MTLEHRFFAKRIASISVLLVLIVNLLPIQTTLAHDPGQGEDVALIQLSARSTSTEIEITGEIGNETCDGLTPVAITARRAGETLRSELRRRERCIFEGTIEVTTQGRWFVYTEFQTENNTIEAWLPVLVGEQEDAFQKSATLYRPPQLSESPTKLIVGIVLYGANISLIAYALYIARKQVLTTSHVSGEV